MWNWKRPTMPSVRAGHSCLCGADAVCDDLTNGEVEPLRFLQDIEARLKSSFILSAMLIWGGLWCGAQEKTVKPLPLSSDSMPDSAMDETGSEGSTYVPVESWIYPALDRLHGLGYVDTAYLGLRPWTRLSIAHMLDLSADRLGTEANNDDAKVMDTQGGLANENQNDENGTWQLEQ